MLEGAWCNLVLCLLFFKALICEFCYLKNEVSRDDRWDAIALEGWSDPLGCRSIAGIGCLKPVCEVGLGALLRVGVFCSFLCGLRGLR